MARALPAQLPDHVHQARQILRPHHDQRHDEQDEDVAPAEKIEHAKRVRRQRRVGRGLVLGGVVAR